MSGVLRAGIGLCAASSRRLTPVQQAASACVSVIGLRAAIGPAGQDEGSAAHTERPGREEPGRRRRCPQPVEILSTACGLRSARPGEGPAVAEESRAPSGPAHRRSRISLCAYSRRYRNTS
ncbi:hypothetical protein GCM10010429_34580 [Micromonospora olivasterospora]